MPYISDYAISNKDKCIASCGKAKYTLAGYNIGIPTKYDQRATSMGCNYFATNIPLFYCPEPSDIIDMNNKSHNIKNALINNNYMQYDWTIDKASPPYKIHKCNNQLWLS
jgi:hypothetical protein